MLAGLRGANYDPHDCIATYLAVSEQGESRHVERRVERRLAFPGRSGQSGSVRENQCARLAEVGRGENRNEGERKAAREGQQMSWDH